MRRLPGFHLLRAFEAAARLHSFSLAARELSVTPSAISHQVRELEEYLDCALFTRAHRRISLTAEGQRLRERLVPLLEGLQEACENLVDKPDHHDLKLYCPPSFAVKWLGPRLPAFVREHPDITLHLSTGIDRVDLLQRPDIDAVVAYLDDSTAVGVIVEPLGAERYAPLCSPRMAAHIGDFAQELSSLTLIGSPLNAVKWQDWCNWNGVTAHPTVRHSMDRSALAVAAAVDGLGIALESTLLAEQELARGDLVELPSPSSAPLERVTHFLRYRESDRARGPLRRFRHWLMTAREQAEPRGQALPFAR